MSKVGRRLEGEAERVISGPEQTIRSIDRWDPLWAPQLLMLVAILLDVALSQRVTVGPRWLLPGLEGFAVVILIVSVPRHGRAARPWRRRVVLATMGVVSAANILSLVLLVQLLVHGSNANGRALIGSGVLLWVTNVLLFGVWFWILDGGGPLARRTQGQSHPDFLFVQMMNPEHAPPGWKPTIIDYLYTSFTNATAFSPTDTMPLTATAKMLMTAQSITALVTIGLVVARAVNILQG